MKGLPTWLVVIGTYIHKYKIYLSLSLAFYFILFISVKVKTVALTNKFNHCSRQ